MRGPCLFSDQFVLKMSNSLSGASLDTQWKVEMFVRCAGLVSVMATSWYVARKIMPLLDPDKESEDNKNKVLILKSNHLSFYCRTNVF